MLRFTRVAAFIDLFNSPLPPEPHDPEKDSNGIRDRGGNGCPKRDCGGLLRPLEIPGDAYCRPTKGRTPIKTCRCPDCGCDFGHVQVRYLVNKCMVRELQALSFNVSCNIKTILVV